MAHQALPGADIVEQGVADLHAGIESIPALLVSQAATRLQEAGIAVPPELISSPEQKLYQRLAAEHGDGAHSKYNAWRRRLLSFLRAARCGSP